MLFHAFKYLQDLYDYHFFHLVLTKLTHAYKELNS